MKNELHGPRLHFSLGKFSSIIILRNLMRIIFLSMIFGGNPAFARISEILPCKTEQDTRPCVPPQSGPVDGVTVKPGLSAQVIGKVIVISWSGPAKEVRMNGIDYESPLPVVANDLRQLVIRFDLAPSVKTHVIVTVTRLDGTRTAESIELVGPQANPAPGAAAADEIKVNFAGTRVGAHVWLPPGYQAGKRYPIVYVADGGGNRGALVGHAINQGILAPVIVVGIDPCEGETNSICRGQNYIDMPDQPELDPQRFTAYENLFVHTIVPQVEAKYGSPPDATQRGVAGESNGAAWATSMALRHSNLFGRAIAMSLAGNHFYGPLSKPDTVFAISGGLLEPMFSNHSRCFAGRVTESGGTATLRIYPAGHSQMMWDEEFMKAMIDWLGVKRAPLHLAPARPKWCPEK